MTSIVSANDDTLLNNNVSKLDQQKALRALALTEEFSLSENGEFQFNNLKVTNIKFNKDQNNIEIETEEAKNGIDNVKKAVADDDKKNNDKEQQENKEDRLVPGDIYTYTPPEFKKKTPGQDYLRFQSKEEELEWKENNDFLHRITPFLYILASTLAFLWAQAFYWWKRLPDEEQICVRDMFDEWFCERGKTAKLTLRNHPTVTVQNLNNRDGLVSYQLAGHTFLSMFVAFATTAVAKCFRRSKKAGNEPNEERIVLLYIVARFIVLCGLICQWGHLALMHAKFKGILMANWAMDFRATIPYIVGIVIGIITVFSYTLYDITSISNEYDTGVAMVVVDNDENSDDMPTSISSRRNDVVNDDDGVSAPR